MPSIPLVAELGAKAAAFQQLLNRTKIPDNIVRKVRPDLEMDDMFTMQDSRTFVRCRPIIPFDNEEVESSIMVQKVSGCRDLVLMVPKISLSGQCSVEPHIVSLDGVFVGEEDDTAVVYEGACASLVQMAVDGASTCVLCYGQTGSGKTYTTSGVLRYIAQDLDPYFETYDIFLNVIEVQALKNVDLLSGSDVQVVEDVAGEVKLLGSEPFQCSSSDLLIAAIEEAASQRVTRSTGRNEASSRSHMIARIMVTPKESRWARPGELFVCDLAGSENTADSSTHDKVRQMEAKFINTSLMTLKDCIRSRAQAGTSKQHVHIPYRRSPLTLLIRDCFELAVRRPTKTVMIACVSPLLRDARHTISTLRYAALLAETPPAKVVAFDPDDPNNFDHDQALEFITKCSRGRISNPEAILPEGDGRALVHIPEAEFIRRVLDSHPHIGEKGALQVYTNIWKHVVDARTKGRKVMTNAKNHSGGPRCATTRKSTAGGGM